MKTVMGIINLQEDNGLIRELTDWLIPDFSTNMNKNPRKDKKNKTYEL